MTFDESDAPVAVGESASDTVFLGIMRGLESHRFAPGQRLVETDLAVQFGVGRNSVREALQRLSAEGVVAIQRHRGAVIRSFSMRETLDVLDVAELMTGLLARTAASRLSPGTGPATLRASLKDLRAATKTGDDVAFSVARRRFYRALLDIGGNRELLRLFPSIQIHIVHAQFRLPNLQTMRLNDYADIAAAVLRSDPEAAQAAGFQHVRNVRAAIEATSGRNE